MDDRRRQISLVFIATDVSQKFRATLEATVVVAIVILLSSLGLRSYERYTVYAQLTEAFMVASTIKADLTVYHAQHGRWPATEAELYMQPFGGDQRFGKYVDHFTLSENGSLSAVFGSEQTAPALLNRQLTFRPMTVSSRPGTPLFWACASYQGPEEFSANGQDKTDIEIALLPASCRSY